MRKWTKQHPKEEGYYFWKPSGHYRKFWIVEMIKSYLGDWYLLHRDTSRSPYGLFGGEIKLPKELKEK